MLILDESSWNGYSCLERGGWYFILALILYAVILLFGFMRTAITLRRPLRQTFAMSREEWWAFSILPVIGLMIATVASLSREGTLLFVENNMLVERGCLQMQPYEDRFAMTGMDISYKGTGRGHKSRHKIIFAETPHSRSIKIDPDYNRYHRNLLAVAPQAMADYRARLEEIGAHLPPIFRTQ